MWSPHRWRDQRGAAAVETALCICFIVLPLTFATIAYAYMFSFRQALSQAASEGARASVGATVGTACAATGPYTPACPAQYAAAGAVASALDTYGMSCGTKFLTCTISQPAACDNATGHQCITVTVDYPYRDHAMLPTFPGLGITLPSNLGFTSVVQVS